MTSRLNNSQASWVIDVLGLCFSWVFVQPGTGRRPVDCSRNQMSVLYVRMFLCVSGTTDGCVCVCVCVCVVLESLTSLQIIFMLHYTKTIKKVV